MDPQLEKGTYSDDDDLSQHEIWDEKAYLINETPYAKEKAASHHFLPRARQWATYVYYQLLQHRLNKSSKSEQHLNQLLTALGWLIRLPLFLIPSFASRTSQRYKITSTSWLDGLRGLACFIVFIYHYLLAYLPSARVGYDGSRDFGYFMQLPVIRIVHSGPTMVTVFFIISGFALSFKSASLLKNPTSSSASSPSKKSTGEQVLSNIASSIWKRWLRLVMPCFAIYMLVACLTFYGAYETVPYGEKGFLPGSAEGRPPRLWSLYAQVSAELHQYFFFAVKVTVFKQPWGIILTNPHLWTIPVEFQQSLYLFLILTGLSHLKRWVRVIIFLPAISIFGLWYGFWENSVFVFGAFLAEIHVTFLTQDTDDLPTYVSKHSNNRLVSILKTVIAIIIFAIGIFIGSYPEGHAVPETVVGFNHLLKWTSPHCDRNRYWMSIGSMMLVSSMMFLPTIKNILCTRILQYLGRISFALYLVHGVMNRTIGYMMVYWAWTRNNIGVPGVPYTQHLENLRVTIVLLVFVVHVLITICVADVLWRAADLPSVRFTKWLESKLVRA
ncbi:hypothetical protein TWF694_003871 [Orbilia ellipsospora]|uniref:Acyltransferase 3 domain-containing protein n=1 Tax=Orbilia ellipsospora TaxID=2528407 RepID=A0AAV9WZI9_9PEZI